MLGAVSGAFDRYTKHVGKNVFPTNLIISIPVDVSYCLKSIFFDIF